jgi:hypothetical protein
MRRKNLQEEMGMKMNVQHVSYGRFVVNGERYFFVPRVICWLGEIYVLLLERIDFAGKFIL